MVGGRTRGAAASAAIVLALVLAACSRDPRDVQADALVKQARDGAEVIRKQADAEAHGLRQQSATLAAQAKQAGGYTGQRLKVQADALGREADIVARQGMAQARAAVETADAQAKTIRSR